MDYLCNTLAGTIAARAQEIEQTKQQQEQDALMKKQQQAALESRKNSLDNQIFRGDNGDGIRVNRNEIDKGASSTINPTAQVNI